MLRVRPGDSLILAGIVTSNDNASSQGLPVGSDKALPLYGKDDKQNRELVIIVKPSIVRFVNESGEGGTRERAALKEKNAKKKEAQGNLPDPADGGENVTKPVDLPKPKPTSQPAINEAPLPEAVQPDPKVSTPPKTKPQPQSILNEPPLSITSQPDPKVSSMTLYSVTDSRKTAAKPVPFKADEFAIQELSVAPVDTVPAVNQSKSFDFSHAFDGLLPSSSGGKQQ